MMPPNNKVFIVEDDFILAKVTHLQLSRLGYDVIGIYSSGEQTLNAIKVQQPDLILMDIQLSGKLDGIQTVEAIQQEFPIPVIYVTGNSDQSTKLRAMNTNCTEYLIKPVDKVDLEQAVRKVLTPD